MKLTENLRNDAFGGLTAAVTALPLAIAFGVLALSPLGPEFASTGALAGLYGAIFVGIFASLFGGTPCQVSGPTGPMTTILTGFVASKVAQGLDAELILTLTFLCVIFGGIVQLLMAWLNLGQLIKFIPYPVVAGFMNGIAVIIFVGQVKPFLGLESSSPWASLGSPSLFQWGTIAAGVATILACKLGPKFLKTVPGALQGLAVGTTTYYGIAVLSPSTRLGPQIGNIPSAFPTPTVVGEILLSGTALLSYLPVVLPIALALGVLGAIDSLLTSVVADTVTRTRHDSRQELVGQGVGNIVSGCFGGLAGAGATVRTLVNVNAGGRGRASGMIHGLLLLMTLVIAGPIAGRIPMVVLAGILLVTAVSMIDQWSSDLLRKIVGSPQQRREILLNLLVVGAVTLITVTVDLMVAVAVGVVISTFLFAHKMSKSIIFRIGRATGHASRKVRPPELAKSLADLGRATLVVELDGSLFFGTTDLLSRTLENHLEPEIHRVILDFRRVKEVDSTGARLLRLLQEQLSDTGRVLALSSITKDGPSWPFLKDMGVLDLVNEELVFPNLDLALEWEEEESLKANLSLSSGSTELAEMTFFKNWAPASVSLLAGYLNEMRVQPGSVLFSPGDDADRFYLIRSGALSRRVEADPASTRVAGFGPGTLVGEIEMLSSGKRRDFLHAETEAEIAELTRATLNVIENQHPEVASLLFASISIELSARLKDAHETISNLE